MKLVFFRCVYGHFFRNISCPFDGWTYGGIAEVERAFAVEPMASISRLASIAEVDDFLRGRIVLIESESIPLNLEGMNPKAFVFDGVISEAIKAEWHGEG